MKFSHGLGIYRPPLAASFVSIELTAAMTQRDRHVPYRTWGACCMKAPQADGFQGLSDTHSRTPALVILLSGTELK
jgi:hypothetical protein